jgi:hypothetical protein
MLSSQSALVDRNTLRPGEESSFRLEMMDVAAASAYQLRFKTFR